MPALRATRRIGCATINSERHFSRQVRSECAGTHPQRHRNSRPNLRGAQAGNCCFERRGNSSRTCGGAGGRKPCVADLCAQQDRGVRATGAWKLAAHAARHDYDRRVARAGCGAERARRRGRNPGAASSAAASGHEARAGSCGPGERRGRISSGESRASGLGPRGARGVHARRVHGNSAAQRDSAGGSRTPSSWGAATLWESRWRCC